MKSAKFQAKVWFYVGLGVAFTLMAIWMLPQFVLARPDEPFEAPPRPTTVPQDLSQDLEPEPPAPPPPPAGINLVLDVRLGGNRAPYWFQLWTAVQWQDAIGFWHTVDGWQGNLDQVTPLDNEAKALKTWWASNDLLGRGPFRWVIFDSQEGHVIAQSEPFKIPADAGQNMVVKVTVP